MRIEIVKNNYEPNQRLLDVVERKVEKLDKFLSEEDKVKIKFGKVGDNSYTMEVSVVQKNKMARAAVVTSNMWDNIDLVMPKIERQLRKLHRKIDKKAKDHIARIPAESSESPKHHSSDSYGKIVREKSFDLSIIMPEQAIEEMELLDHSFYVFVNASNNKVSVIYKRLDGNYGLITPER